MCGNAIPISSYILDDQKVFSVNSIIKPHFNYCPLLWIYCFYSLINLLNQTHGSALRMI